MRLCFGLALAILLTGGAYGLDRPVSLFVGQSFTFTTFSFGEVDQCHLMTPSGKVIDFTPGDESQSTDKYEIQQGSSMIQCAIVLKNAAEEDEGTWELYHSMEGKLGANQIFFLTVRPRPASSESESNESTTEMPSEESDESEEDEHTTVLSVIRHFTMQTARIDISLNRESFEEECYIRPPGRGMREIRVSELEMEGVTVQSKSKYVSCRVSIGPMTDQLIGVWRLCGKSVVNEEIRCQPVNIAWDRANGLAQWGIVEEPRAALPVHFGGSVNSGTSGSGDIITCHVITPADEDLVVSADVKYPHIENTATTRPICDIIFTDITDDMLGNWTIIGRFRNTFGQNEMRRPLNFYLHNEDDPYQQAYNVTELQDERHIVHLGGEVTLQVGQRAGVVQNCIYTTPKGQTFDSSNYEQNTIEGVSFKSSDTGAICQIIISPITEESTGKWQITGKFRNGALFDKIQRSFDIIIEDPSEPIDDEVDRVVETLTPQLITTEINRSHRVVISTGVLIENESCHLITPAGLQYKFIDGFNVPGVEILEQHGVECGIILSVRTFDMIGDWTLIARGKRLSDPIERRLPFTIRVEENFVLQNDINIRKGADLYLHLNQDVEMPETCKIFGPDGEEYLNAEKDPLHIEKCGYIVKGVDHHHTGKWILEYGEHIKLRGSVNVHVAVPDDYYIEPLQWTSGDSIDITLGPEDAVYCRVTKLINSIENTFFDNFGPCRVVVDRVTSDHRGQWKILVGIPGGVMMNKIIFNVTVVARDGRPMVTTAVERRPPSVLMSCSVPNQHQLNSCVFRSPRGHDLIATHGVGEEGYMFNGSFVNEMESNAQSHDCSLRLATPTVDHMGIWRCAMQTSTGIYYGFLTVLCPHLLQDPQTAASIERKPVLRAKFTSVMEHEPATMSCSINTELRYCYFRASNGTVYNVFPTMSSSLDFEYVGAGLDAGECGIRFKRGLSSNENATWSCHVGLAEPSVFEQQAPVDVEVIPMMQVFHIWRQSRLSLEVFTANNYKIDYCRFVRIDGLGFTTDNMGDGNTIYHLTDTYCNINIWEPTMLDFHPWTVAVKFVEQDGEISMTTTENLLDGLTSPSILGAVLFWMLIMFICLVPAMAASALIPKKNRQWTYRRASSVRNSFRNSWNNTFHKTPIQQVNTQTTTEVNTPVNPAVTTPAAV